MPVFQKLDCYIEATRIMYHTTMETPDGVLRGEPGDWLVTFSDPRLSEPQPRQVFLTRAELEAEYCREAQRPYFASDIGIYLSAQRDAATLGGQTPAGNV